MSLIQGLIFKGTRLVTDMIGRCHVMGKFSGGKVWQLWQTICDLLSQVLSPL